MKQRNPIVSALLSFIIPFYLLYWLYSTGKTLVARGAEVPSFFKFFILPFLVFVGITILQFITRFVFASGDPLGENSSNAITVAVNAISLIAGLIGFFAILVLPLVYLYKFSEAARKVTSDSVSTVLLLLLFLFLNPLAVYIVDDKLNGTSTPAATPGSQSPLPPAPAS